MIKNYQHLITSGIDVPLENVKEHGVAPFNRILMSGKEAEANFNKHIAIHVINENLPYEKRFYSLPHKHNCDEWNIILGTNDLTFEIMLNGELFIVKSPATVYIPQGTSHSANVLSGSGYFIALVDTLDYDKSFII